MADNQDGRISRQNSCSSYVNPSKPKPKRETETLCPGLQVPTRPCLQCHMMRHWKSDCPNLGESSAPLHGGNLETERGFLTTKGTPIVNGPLTAKLLEALSLPTEVAVVHCHGHQTSKDPVSQGNNRADLVARQTALNTSLAPILFLNTPHGPSYSEKEVQTLQGLGGKPGDKGWIYIQNKIALPENMAHTLITDIHQSLHVGPKALHQFLQPLFHHPSLSRVIGTVHRACKTC
ncbi:ORM1-like protein 2 isoform X1 [Ailuropoda melanoleuca]|uniref:ORM1-like protein 2 isoform X1 n=1 Tax=Ailuropoda melanoleuca TaxID=9646 RepID=UPI001494378E|nr:ORM1-like protein 2 isoform X1 [Ailuropoda melanoleuca]XP_034499761.1 ORM1-like protein 2 isoform X1 [Ailuropoda melanoleuca]